VVILVCKKFVIKLPAASLADHDPKSSEPAVSCGGIRAQRIFKNEEIFLRTFESLPKDYKEFFKKCVEPLKQGQLDALLELFVQNFDLIGILV